MAEPSSADPASVRLAALEAGQSRMNQALGLMLDTLHQQTNLLREIADAVKDEPGPSPVIQALDELTEAVVSMGAGIETLTSKLDELPDAIGTAMMGGPPPPEADTASRVV
jgi:methyl-accepting chemotaxis protein